MIGYLPRDHALIHAFARLAPASRAPRAAAAAPKGFRQVPRLSDYVRGEEILAAKGLRERAISGLAVDSRRVGPGMLFFALPGRHRDGAEFIADAVGRGAVAVVSERMPALPSAGVTYLQVADVRAALARAAQRHFKFPDRDLALVGVTGMRGKTCVAHLTKHLLNGDRRIGLIGSVHYALGARTVPSTGTTPEALEVYGLMAQMRDAGCRQAVIELSGLALEQRRVSALALDVAVFTGGCAESGESNGDSEADYRRFFRLFAGLDGPVPKVAAVNVDDAAGRRLAAHLVAEVPATRVVTFGEDPAAGVRADAVTCDLGRSRFRLVWPGGTKLIETPLVGRFNVANVLAAVAAAIGLGRDPAVFLSKLRTFPGAPGRLERVEAGQAATVLVDSAHTAAELKRTLAALRTLTAGRLLVVFGCGGNRERAGRPDITRAVQAQADFAFATADNPRREGVARIFADMRAGVTAPSRITWIEDRRRAIGYALELARPGDCVVIAGKGHENCQEVSDTMFPFDDRQVVRELLAPVAVGAAS
jgi:UDP-N-acetylmuramoyl-L-alanyl-D-glutamate--2,6-diaminopimelate ligase